MSDGTKLISNNSYEFDLPKPLRVFLATVTGLFFGIMILKYGNIFLSAISTTSSGKIQFTLQNFRDLRAEHIGSFWRSIIFSISAGILSSITGILLLNFLAKCREYKYVFTNKKFTKVI